jgi:hypothetical protein
MSVAQGKTHQLWDRDHAWNLWHSALGYHSLMAFERMAAAP